MRHVVCALALILFWPVHADAEAPFDADLSLIWAELLNGDTTPDTGLQIHGQYVWVRPSWEVHAEGRARWNEAYADTKTYGKAARKAYRWDADWREFYIATQRGGWQVSVGWQQVVWGRADNLRILDQVNPLDLREFVLPDINDYRRSVFMLRTMGQIGDWIVEPVYLPEFVENRYAVTGSELYIPTVDLLIAQGFTLRPKAYPKNPVESAEIGLQASRHFSSMDVSMVLFYTRDDDPVYRILPPETAEGMPALQPEYHRQLQLGAGLAKAVDQGFILRSEFSVIPSVAYNTFDAPDGVTKSRTLRGLVGIDYLWRDWLLSLQHSDRLINDWQPGYWTPKGQAVSTFSATGSSFSARLETRLAVTVLSDRGGQWGQLRNVFKLSDHVHIGCSVNWLNGDQAGFFGQFRDRDRVRIDAKYLF